MLGEQGPNLKTGPNFCESVVLFIYLTLTFQKGSNSTLKGRLNMQKGQWELELRSPHPQNSRHSYARHGIPVRRLDVYTKLIVEELTVVEMFAVEMYSLFELFWVHRHSLCQQLKTHEGYFSSSCASIC